jgi:protein-tyrosine phosphatase
VDKNSPDRIATLSAVAPTSADEARYRVTVVCLGNICRSPIGEAVVRDRIQRAGLAGRVVVDSAGTGDWELGSGADRRALAVLAKHGYTLDGHVARQITPAWFGAIDLVVAMDESNHRDLARMIATSGQTTQLRMMRSFDPALAHLPEPHPELDVPDPYYGGAEGFPLVLDMIEQAADGLVDGLLKERS